MPRCGGRSCHGAALHSPGAPCHARRVNLQPCLLAVALGVLLYTSAARADEMPRPSATASVSPAPEVAAPPMVSAPPAAAPPAAAPPEGEADRTLEERLAGIFANVDELSRVQVTVRSGVVRLRGTTPRAESRKQAEELAKATPGIVFVDNDIEQVTDVGERIEPTLGRFAKRLDAIVQRAPLYGVAFGMVTLFAMLAGVVRRWRAPFRLLIRRPIVRDMAQQISAFALVIVGLLIALELLDATALVGAVLGAAGVAGIALGFAFRDIAENYLASILLGVRRPFAANDHIVIEGHEGKVMRLTMRETVLMTLEGNHVRLPNALVFKAVILNYTANPLRRFHVSVGVGVTSDLAEAQAVGNAALRQTPGVAAEPPPFTRVEELGDSNVLVKVFGWVDQREADWFKVRSESVRRVKSAFDAAGIDMPVPVQRVQFETLQAEEVETERGARRDVGRSELAKVAIEVAPDDVLEKQMAVERSVQADEDLLDAAAPP